MCGQFLQQQKETNTICEKRKVENSTAASLEDQIDWYMGLA